MASGLKLQVAAMIELKESNGQRIHNETVNADSSFLLPPFTAQVAEVPNDTMALQALAESLAANISVSLLNQAW